MKAATKDIAAGLLSGASSKESNRASKRERREEAEGLRRIRDHIVGKDEKACLHVLAHLCRYGLQEVVAGVVALLMKDRKSKAERVRDRAAQALVVLAPRLLALQNPAAAIEGLLLGLDRGDPGPRLDAIDRLASIGPAASGAVPALTRLLEDRDPLVRRAACSALSRITGETPGHGIPAA